MVNGVPFALDKPSFVFSQYFVGMIPLLIQFTYAPLSISATVLVEKLQQLKLLLKTIFEM